MNIAAIIKTLALFHAVWLSVETQKQTTLICTSDKYDGMQRCMAVSELKKHSL